MKRSSIALPDDLEAALDSYLGEQDVAPSITGVVEAALREYLARRGHLPPSRPLRITPAKAGSARKDVSLNHDRYLAGK
jgi:hypothetical protein